MTSKELTDFERSLKENGYRKWSVCKTSEKTSHEWMKTIDGVIVSFRVWDYSKYKIGEPYNVDVCLVRDDNEIRADLTITNCISIGYIEHLTKQFKNIKL